MLNDIFNFVFRYRYSSESRFEATMEEVGEGIANHYQRGNVFSQLGKRLTRMLMLNRIVKP